MRFFIQLTIYLNKYFSIIHHVAPKSPKMVYYDKAHDWTKTNIQSLIKNNDTQYCKVEDIATKINKQDFLILHINIRSIHANINKLHNFLTEYNLSPPISETKLKVSESCRVSLKGYNFIHNGSVTNAWRCGNVHQGKHFL